MFVNFSNKFPFGVQGQAQFVPELCNDDLLSEISLLLLQYRTQQAQKSNSQFSQKLSLGRNGQFGPNLSQNYATLYKDLFEML